MMHRLIFLDLRTRPFRPMHAPDACVLCLGNFDGVHIAHTAILREGIRASRERQAPCLCGVFCFFRPSADYLTIPGTKKDTRPPVGTHLTTLKEKLTLIADLGVDFACLSDFNDIRMLPPEDFIRLLKEDCGCVGTSCGFNHRFGVRGSGTPPMLADAFDMPGAVGAHILPEMTRNGVTVSSTAIRQALSDGNAALAATLLGRPYSLDTVVTHGKRLGRTIGFPTANQYFPAERLIPRHGVYAARAVTPDGSFAAVTNVGLHPTVDAHARVNCETHILGLHTDLYGTHIRVELLRFCRPEMKFDSLDALIAQITRDASDAMALADTGNPEDSPSDDSP